MGSRGKVVIAVVVILLLALTGLFIFIEFIYAPPLKSGVNDERRPRFSTSCSRFEDDNENHEEVRGGEPKNRQKQEQLYVETIEEEEEEGEEEEEAEKKKEEKQTVLLIHGAFGSTALWKHITEIAWPAEKRRNYQLVLPDLLGHGKSPRSLSINYSVKEHVDSLVDVLRRFVPSHRCVHIVSISLGAPVAVALAARLVRTLAPWPLRSVTLVSAAYFPSTDRKHVMHTIAAFDSFYKFPNTMYLFARYVAPKIHFLLYPLLHSSLRKMLPATDYVKDLVDNALKVDARGLRSSMESLAVQYDVDAGLKTLQEVDMPLLILDGTADKIYFRDPERKHMLSMAGKNAKRVLVPNGTHIFCAERPDALIENLLPFLEKHR